VYNETGIYFERRTGPRQHVASSYSFNQSFTGKVRPPGPLRTPSITISITDSHGGPQVHGSTAEGYSESRGAVQYKYYIVFGGRISGCTGRLHDAKCLACAETLTKQL